MSNENRKNTKGISDYMWALQAHLDAVKSGRITMFGNGRGSSFKFDKVEITISAEDVKKIQDRGDANESDHEGE